MRTLMLAGATATLIAMTSQAGAQGAWCTEDMNARNCGFFTLAQCQAAASGNGAYCYPNQFVAPAAAAEPRKSVRPAKQGR